MYTHMYNTCTHMYFMYVVSPSKYLHTYSCFVYVDTEIAVGIDIDLVIDMDIHRWIHRRVAR